MRMRWPDSGSFVHITWRDDIEHAATWEWWTFNGVGRGMICLCPSNPPPSMGGQHREAGNLQWYRLDAIECIRYAKDVDE